MDSWGDGASFTSRQRILGQLHRGEDFGGDSLTLCIAQCVNLFGVAICQSFYRFAHFYGQVYPRLFAEGRTRSNA